MGQAQESGYILGLQLVSLSGIKGQIGRGRQLDQQSYSMTTAARSVLNNNPSRISALLVNRGSSAGNVSLDFGANGTSMALAPGQSLQLDQLLPWSGQVMAVAASTATLDVIEVSVP